MAKCTLMEIHGGWNGLGFLLTARFVFPARDKEGYLSSVDEVLPERPKSTEEARIGKLKVCTHFLFQH